jgi:hypothetical protein
MKMKTIDEKIYARAEIWRCLTGLKERVKEIQKTETLSENTAAAFETVEQITAAIREYFQGDEQMDLERNPGITEYIRNSLRQEMDALH